ncbi:MAG: hypothetical protein K9G80_01465 [Candidatus Nanopelagicales bacterium]|nr:hypothetical protein [Candidatus Nanopelagicales bacterium]MCF8536776.1 hypothetical protein [Candidatus Nanopelagicales bacterium]
MALRCDASESMGTGHVTRMYALAQQLQARGLTPVFTGSVEGPEWLHVLTAAYPSASATRGVSDADAVVVDSYLASVIEEVLAAKGSRPLVLVADDATPRAPADAYIVPGVNAGWRPAVEAANVPRIAGPGAVLIRDEIRRTGPRPSPASSDPTVLVALGGGGGYGLTASVLAVVASIGVPCRVRVIGSGDASRSSSPGQVIEYIRPGIDIGNEYRSADAVICSAGVTAWEVLHHGIPAVIISAVQNQQPNYEFMTSGLLALGAGMPSRGEAVEAEAIGTLLSDAALRAQLSSNAWDAVDGLGAMRAADMIVALLH